MGTELLIIEDNEQNLYLARFLLEKAGYQVADARDGETGIRRAKELKPALILLDIQLPGMDGHAVARALKGDAALKSIPIVAVTSYAMAGDREKVFAAGAAGYIEKPIDPATFVTEVERFLPPPAKETDT